MPTQEKTDVQDYQYEVERIPAIWLTAIVNADRTGLTDEEERIMDDYLDTWLEGYRFIDVVRDEDGEFTPYFAWNVINFNGWKYSGDVVDCYFEYLGDDKVTQEQDAGNKT